MATAMSLVLLSMFVGFVFGLFVVAIVRHRNDRREIARIRSAVYS